MRIAALALVLGAWPRLAEASCEDPFGDPDEVLEVHLRLPRSEWDALVGDTPGAGCPEYPWREADFRCGEDEPWLAVGVRHKRGDQRGMDTDEKPPLKLDFNRIVAGQRWPASRAELGFRKLSLNQGQPDGPGTILSVLLSENLAWRILRDELPVASRIAFASLWVHVSDEADAVEYHGLYLLIEDIDRTALRARFGGEDEGRLYKNTGGACDGIEIDDGDPNEASTRFEAWMAEDPGAHAGAWAAETDGAMHLEELLRQEAVREIWANHDNVFNDDRNYYWWDPREGRRVYLPWDLDDAFNVVEWYDPDTPLGDGRSSTMGERIRDHAEIRPRYLAIVCQLLNGTMHPDRVLSRADAIDAVIRPIIGEETGPVWDGRDPLDASNAPCYQSAFELLHEWLPARDAALRAQLAAEGVDCPEGCPEGATEPCAHIGCDGVRACEGGLWTGCRPGPDCAPVTPCADAGPEPDHDGGAEPGRDAGTDGEDDGGPAPGESAPGGCGCSTSGSARVPWLGLLCLALVPRSPRRRAPSSTLRSAARWTSAR